jgi:hypothetical protein
MSDHVAYMDTTPRWKRRLRELIGRAKFHAGTPYRRFVYRYHMRLIHPRWHWWTHMRPMGGPPQDWCQWCGKRRTYN